MGKEKSKNKRFKRLRIVSSSEEEINHLEEDLPSQNQRKGLPRASSRSRSRSPIVIVHRDASPRRSRSSTARGSTSTSARLRSASPPQHVEPGPSAAPVDKEKESTEEIELDEDILMLFGDAPKDDTPLGPPIHKDIASRWQEILTKGMPKDVKDKLLKEYSIPSNCDLLLAPVLNPEAKAALSDVFVKRDALLMNKQKQLGVAMSALAKLTQLILTNETSKQTLLKPLSDACRILCDSHYMETKTRRNFVTSSINTTLKDTLIEAERNKFLFGDNVGEKLKVAKNIQRSGEILKHQQKPVFNKNNFAFKRGRLNSKPIHRKTDNKPAAGETARATRPTQRQPPRNSSSGTRKTTYRSPQRRNYRH